MSMPLISIQCKLTGTGDFDLLMTIKVAKIICITKHLSRSIGLCEEHTRI